MKQISNYAETLIESIVLGAWERGAYADTVLGYDEEEEWDYQKKEVELLMTYIADLEAENRALRHSLELRECEEMEHKPDPLEGVQFVSLSNAEIAAMTPEHPLYKLVKGDRKCDDE